MSIWSEYFENRDPAKSPWAGDEWSNGLRTLKVIGAMFAKPNVPSLVVFEDSSIGRVGCTGGIWKRELRSFQCTRRGEESYSSKAIAKLKKMEIP